MRLRDILMQMPRGDCPSCGRPIDDWHVEWVAPPNQGPVFRGEVGVDCPGCGVPIIITQNQHVIGVAPPGKGVKRSRAQAEKWADSRSINLDDYLRGSQYQNYEFEP
jgi:endogenous inhibitor of DNA gyrase (YacG/DUF329 family)